MEFAGTTCFTYPNPILQLLITANNQAIIFVSEGQLMSNTPNENDPLNVNPTPEADNANPYVTPQYAQDPLVGMERSAMRRITGLGVVSFAKLMGFCGVIIGLIIGLIYGGLIILVTVVGGIAGGEMGVAGIGIVGGVVAIVVFPIVYGVMSFIGGLIYGAVLNFALSKTGGLEIRIE
jgi:hypothetical protein